VIRGSIIAQYIFHVKDVSYHGAQLVVAASDKINYYDIYVHVYAIQILLILCKFIV